jgi:hypothetical protein
MSGKILVIAILSSALLGGAALYYLQVYGFYRSVEDPGVVAIEGPKGPISLTYSDFEGIDANSSPLRYRACFSTDAWGPGLPEALDEAVPRNAPGWFECFNAEAIALALKTGAAKAYIAQKNIHYGVDRIVAITNGGRGFIWHDLNDCGEKAYDGTVVGEICPPRPWDSN